MTEKSIYHFKVALVGDTAVGKTSLIDRFVNHKFEENYIATMGVSITLKDLVINGTTVQLMLWDIGGSEKWDRVRGMFYRGSSGIIVVYDVTRPATFLNVTHYLQYMEEAVQKKIPFIVLGNKLDLTEIKKIDPKEAKNLMNESNAIAFFETSAKTGNNVENAFYLIAEACLKQAERK